MVFHGRFFHGFSMVFCGDNRGGRRPWGCRSVDAVQPCFGGIPSKNRGNCRALTLSRFIKRLNREPTQWPIMLAFTCSVFEFPCKTLGAKDRWEPAKGAHGRKLVRWVVGFRSNEDRKQNTADEPICSSLITPTFGTVWPHCQANSSMSTNPPFATSF